MVAVKSSDKDDIEGVDLLDKSCPVRFIITKSALQEGWDCAFAYILVVLTNPSSQTAMTQLVGRILRQPNARKTKVTELDESYVYCFKKKGDDILKAVRDGFMREGLGDLAGRIAMMGSGQHELLDVNVRKKFQYLAGRVYLPVFAIKDGDDGWRRVSYEMDIVRRIDWSKARLEDVTNITLAEFETKNVRTDLGIAPGSPELVIKHGEERYATDELQLNEMTLARQVSDIVPNPWSAIELVELALKPHIAALGREKVAANVPMLLEKLRTTIQNEKDRLAKQVFDALIKDNTLRFMVFKDEPGYHIPKTERAKKNARRLNRQNGTPLEKSLFDMIPEEELNNMEKDVAYL